MKPALPTAEPKPLRKLRRPTITSILWLIAVLSAGLLVLFDDPAPAESRATASATPLPSR